MYGGDAGSCALHCPTSPGAAQWTRPPPTLPTCVSAVRLSSDESTFCYPASRGLAAPGARRATSPCIPADPAMSRPYTNAVSFNWCLASGRKAFRMPFTRNRNFIISRSTGWYSLPLKMQK